MTRKLILPLAAIILLSSCAGKFGLQKRRYTKGYYVSSTKKNHAPATHEQATKHAVVKTTMPGTAVVNETVPVSLPLVVNTPQKNEVIVAKPATATPVVSSTTHKILASNTTKEVTVQKAHYKVLDLKTKINAAKSGGEADANAVVLIILCIFIPPLAVYLFEKKLKIDFWLDLILTLIFWLPGIIFAFLVCFAGVSL